MGMMLLLKATLLLSTTVLAARLLRRAPAVIHHRIWSLGFAAVLALPLFAFTLPAIHIPAPPGWRSAASLLMQAGSFTERPTAGEPLADGQSERTSRQAAATRPGGLTADMSTVATQPATPSPRAVSQRVSTGATLIAVWLIGATTAAVTLMLSLIRARTLARTADDVVDEAWRATADLLGARLGLSRPARLLMSPAVGTPMAGGVWRPAIFLPESARTWNVERRTVVLAHEIAHLAAHDPLRHVAARLAVALYWFHPLVWIAARQAAVAREQACDQAVLALGTRPSAYARVLLDLAEAMHPPVHALGALPMVERSLLEKRLMAILNDDIRPATGRTTLLPAVIMAALTLAVAAAQPAVPASPTTVVLSDESQAAARPVAAANVAPTPAERSAASLLATGAALQPAVGRDSACWWDAANGSTFSGNISMSETGGRTVIHEQVGTRGASRVIQKSFGDLRLCMISEEIGERDDGSVPSQWLDQARRTVLEARRGSVVQRLEVGRQAGSQRISWRVGSQERPFDAPAQQWRDRMLATLDTIWELSRLRGEVSSLRGEISSIHGHESSLRGQISSLRGEISSMRGRASSVRGEESSLRGEISSIRGHVSSLHGAISSERGAISSLNANRYQAGDAERGRIATSIRQHEAEIERIERAIRDYGADAKIAPVEREIASLDAAGKVAAIDAEIRAFDLDGKVAAVERSIAGLDVAGKVDALERKITALDADRRGRQLEDRRDAALKQLEAAIKAIRD